MAPPSRSRRRRQGRRGRARRAAGRTRAGGAELADAQAGRDQELAALEPRRRVRQLGDVHPADLVVEPGAPRRDAELEAGQSSDVADGEQGFGGATSLELDALAKTLLRLRGTRQGRGSIFGPHVRCGRRAVARRSIASPLSARENRRRVPPARVRERAGRIRAGHRRPGSLRRPRRLDAEARRRRAPKAPGWRMWTGAPTSISRAGSPARTPATGTRRSWRRSTSRSTASCTSASWSAATSRTSRCVAGSPTSPRARAPSRSRSCSTPARRRSRTRSRSPAQRPAVRRLSSSRTAFTAARS